ncbi:MAG: hypothetical protein K0R41_2373 [Geminicoccaceae bacterium]|jgi:hypothetical protein|nr:hypothetical protein [Geminicoccaceae bacterium]
MQIEPRHVDVVELLGVVEQDQEDAKPIGVFGPDAALVSLCPEARPNLTFVLAAG